MTSIEIHSGKLVEWVASRFKMSKDWSDKLLIIREKISKALLDMPETEEIKTLILGTYINYFHCIKIFDILKDTESSTKNIFGQYSSKRIKDWQEIIRLYENNKYYIIDCSQILNQFVSFDIPAIKKSIERNNKTLNDSVRKEKDYNSAISEANANWKNLYQKYSLEGDVSEELVEVETFRILLKKSLQDLPPILGQIESTISSLRQSRDLYDRFVHKALLNDDNITEKCLPMLTYLLDTGNTTVYEWKYNKRPMVEISKKSSEINMCAEMVKDQSEEINEEISWDCSGDDFALTDFQIELNDEENSTDETLTILEDYNTREMLLDDLHELSAFFISCIDETKLRVGSILDLIENIEEKWPELNSETVEMMRNTVTRFMEQITDKSFMHLLMLKSNPSYLDSILKRVEHERSVILKNKNLINILRKRVSEAAHESVSMEHQLVTLKEQCGILKGQIENAISKAFGDRRVRIIGEISTI